MWIWLLGMLYAVCIRYVRLFVYCNNYVFFTARNIKIKNKGQEINQYNFNDN